MNVSFALALLKHLVSNDKFKFVARQNKMALPVSNETAKTVVRQMSIDDFVSYSEDRDRPGEFLWIFITDDGQKYYLKFKFIHQDTMVKFISFHISYLEEGTR